MERANLDLRKISIRAGDDAVNGMTDDHSLFCYDPTFSK